LIGSSDESDVAESNWGAVDSVQRKVEVEAKKGRRLEIWVAAIGRLRTRAGQSPLGVCDREGSGLYGYGHLGAYPAELVVRYFTDIEIKVNPNSPFDYSHIHRFAL
jgi:hypothetical protein